MISDFFTVKDAAEILQVTERTLRGYIKAGKLKARKFGNFWRIAEPDLQAFLESGSETADCNRRKENRRGTGD